MGPLLSSCPSHSRQQSAITEDVVSIFQSRQQSLKKRVAARRNSPLLPAGQAATLGGNAPPPVATPPRGAITSLARSNLSHATAAPPSVPRARAGQRAFAGCVVAAMLIVDALGCVWALRRWMRRRQGCASKMSSPCTPRMASVTKATAHRRLRDEGATGEPEVQLG